MSLILVMLTSLCDSDFECSNISVNENKLDGVDLSSDGLDYWVRKNGGKILWFSADCLDGYVHCIYLADKLHLTYLPSQGV